MDVKTLHRQAMEEADLAILARQKGDAIKALAHSKKAYELEAQAAYLLINRIDAEPTRSVLFRSAASLAIDAKLPLEAERLICSALIGNPPSEIAEELRDLYEQSNFLRHLALRGISLHEDEVQMSIAGDGVGFGLATTDAFLDRVEKTETLLYRTAERKLDKPFRDRGRRDKKLTDSLELYMTVPRAASFAVTFRVGKGEQMNLPGLSFAGEVIDELLDCLQLFNTGNNDALKQHIPQEDYYNNFVGLARSLAPDGKSVNLVGFTTVRDGAVKQVAITGQRPHARAVAEPTEPSTQSASGGSVQVIGTLRYADAIHDKDQIRIVADDNTRHIVIVPPGMMSDIVRPLWDTRVLIIGTRTGGKITLQDIQPAEAADEPTSPVLAT